MPASRPSSSSTTSASTPSNSASGRVAHPASVPRPAPSVVASRNAALVATLLDGLTDDDIFGLPSSMPSNPPSSQPSAPKRRRLSSPPVTEGVLPLSSSQRLNRPKQVPPSRPKPNLPPAPPAQEDEYSALFDEFPLDDDWEADLLLPPLHPKVETEPPLILHNPPPTAPPAEWAKRPWVRCTVTAVDHAGYDANGWEIKHVLVLTHKTQHPLSVHLKGEYAELPISPGDHLNLISPELPSLIPSSPRSSTSASTSTVKLELDVDPCFEASTDLASPACTPTITLSTAHPENFIVFHPDLLLPNTTISTSLSCPRKSVMSGLVKASTVPTAPLLYGNLLHATLQALLSTTPNPTRSTFSASNIKRVSDEVLTQGDDTLRGDLWKAGLGMEDVREEVGNKAVEAFSKFGEKFLGGPDGTPNPDATLGAPSTSLVSLTGLHDTEEDIRSPMWGIQGKIDVSIQATILDPASSAPSFGGRGKENIPVGGRPPAWSGKGEAKDESNGQSASWTMPFEIKTGRAVGVMEHRAQTMLYTLLMEDRYSTPIPSGLLYYSQSDTILQIPAAKHELRSLIMARNTLAGYLARKRPPPPPSPPVSAAVVAMPSASPTPVPDDDEEAKKKREEEEQEDALWAEMDAEMEVDVPVAVAEKERPSFLPPSIENAWECKRCYQSDSCMLYRKAIEQVEDVDSPIAEMYEKKTGHLSASHADFFRQWEELISFEEQDATRFASELWTMTAEEREKTGRCFGNMVVESYSVGSGPAASKVHRHTYVFRRSSTYVHPASTPSKPIDSLLSGHLSSGEAISVSIEPDLLSLARGFILALTPTHLTVGLDHKLDVEVLISRLRTSSLGGSGLTTSSDPRDQIFRIDKDELASGMGRIRNNLAQMFIVDGDEKRRSLVVDLDKPTFDEDLKPTVDEFEASGLNGDQRDAMEKVLTAKDYALILGMPGTGKTTTIVQIIIALAKRGKSVLLTSYTHSAVDTILVKLVNLNLRLLRLGNPDKVHPDCQHLTLGALGPAATMEQYEHRLMSPQVVATTALTIDHPVFVRRKFDYCIVDEASQITLPVCLGPLRFADAFILVGDHFQLPPLVKNPTARLGGLDVSLFRRLHEAHPEASVDLSHQYRMNADIMELSNTLIYEGRLRCGSKEVAERGLVLPRREDARTVMHQDGGCDGEKGCWIEDVMEESSKVVFLDTDLVPCPDSRIGHLIQNVGEAHLAHQITRALLLAGVSPREIGIITLYRQQIKLLQHVFSSDDADGSLKDVEILTADKSQGRDKDVIIISMVRSNETGSIGELLRDWRRINVALTRARSKLIFLGSRSTLSTDPLLARFFNLLEGNQWIRELEPGVGGRHAGLGKVEEVKREVEEIEMELSGRVAGGEKRMGEAAGSKRGEEMGVQGKKRARVGKEEVMKGREMLRDLMGEEE